MDTFTFEHLVRLAREIAPQRLLDVADRRGLTSLVWIDEVSSGRYKTRGDLRKELRKKVLQLVDRVDVRNFAVLLELCPKGYDSRIPSWLYEPTVIPELSRPAAGRGW